MNIKKLQDIDCTNKKVLVRVDYNVDLQSLANQTESFRLSITKATVEHILNFPGATVTLLTHFGRPEGVPDSRYSVKPLVPILENLFGKKVSFTTDALGQDDLSAARIALRENVRFYPEEEAGDKLFAEKLAFGFDLYVNEAFSVSHRNHASISTITRFLPSVAGLHLQEEIAALTAALEHPARPAIAILGGAKIETKLPLIHIFEKKYDAVLLGGRIANEAIDQNITLAPHVHLPTDFRSHDRLDIGDRTVLEYTNLIAAAGSIVWNGPLGKFEEPPFDTGTTKIVDALAKSNAVVIAGGGESLAAIQKEGVFDELNLVSSGGGAMLAFLAGKKMPGIEYLV
jgi:3-phosphoglycerate kinase